MENLGLEGQRGGMTVYYTAPYDKQTKVTAFKPVSLQLGFKPFLGSSLRLMNLWSNTSECSNSSRRSYICFGYFAIFSIAVLSLNRR